MMDAKGVRIPAWTWKHWTFNLRLDTSAVTCALLPGVVIGSSWASISILWNTDCHNSTYIGANLRKVQRLVEYFTRGAPVRLQVPHKNDPVNEQDRYPRIIRDG